MNDLEKIINSQKEMIGRYDNKATAYISISANTFVIALFTLCIFTALSEGKIERKSGMFITLLIIMIVYCTSFITAISMSMAILFPRGSKKNNSEHIKNSATNFEIVCTNQQIEYYVSNKEEIFKEYIKENSIILNNKHRWSKLIIYPIIIMNICLILTLILLFLI